MATTAPLVAQYAKRRLIPTSPATEPIFTITPFASASFAMAAFVTRYMPSTFTRNRRAKSSSGVSSMFPTRPIPALLTRMSRPAMEAKAEFTAAGLVISQIKTDEFGNRRESASALGRSISRIVTAAPAAANTRHVASPIPLAPPVTRARRPSKRKGVSMGSHTRVTAAQSAGLGRNHALMDELSVVRCEVEQAEPHFRELLFGPMRLHEAGGCV